MRQPLSGASFNITLLWTFLNFCYRHIAAKGGQFIRADCRLQEEARFELGRRREEAPREQKPL